MSWRQFIKPEQEVKRVKRVESPPVTPLKTLKTLKPRQMEPEKLIPVEPFPEWQRDLCEAHADFNHWRGQCPVSLDQCLITKVIESGGKLDQLRGVGLGHGITTDAVIDLWLEVGEPAVELLTKPTWLVCLADHLRRRTNGDEKTT